MTHETNKEREASPVLPEFVMLVGIPASGKSTHSAEYERNGYRVLSSDRIRAEMLDGGCFPSGDPKGVERLNREVFATVRRETATSLRAGISVAVDATNLNRKKRTAFLAELAPIPVQKTCVLFITPREICLARNAKRTGVARVPDREMKKMLSAFECPNLWEGWDRIVPIVPPTPYAFPFAETRDFSQDNPHHTLSLYGHMEAAARYAREHGYPQYLERVARYHDIGKLYTKTFRNARGERTETAHFYGHENYGAYLYLSEMCCGKTLTEEEFSQILYETNLINCHMRPLNAWSGSEAAKERDARRFGERFIDDVLALNAADVAAH